MDRCAQPDARLPPLRGSRDRDLDHLPGGGLDRRLRTWAGERPTNVDTVAGLALLLWAFRETGDPSFHEIAVKHALRHIDFCLRADGSICQSASFDPETGKPLRRYTHKGIRDDSTWARAQAWGIVGYALMYQWERDPRFLDVASRAADWWLAHAPKDRVAFWDFDDPVIPHAPRDTSATAIVTAALLKLARLAPSEVKRREYREAAQETAGALIRDYLTERGILTHGCYNRRIGLATQHELIWGSYYLFESLLARAGRLEPTAV